MGLFGGEVKTLPYQAPDYSGSVAAARSLAMTQAQGIAGIGTQAVDYFKGQGEKKKLIKQSDIQIDAALKLFPDLAPTLQGVRDQIKDENVSLNERAGIAESVAGLIKMTTDEMRALSDDSFKKRQLDIQEGSAIQSALEHRARMTNEANKPLKMYYKKVIVPDQNASGDYLSVDVKEDDYGNRYDPITGEKITDWNGWLAGGPAILQPTTDDTSELPQIEGARNRNPPNMLPPPNPEGEPELTADAQNAADIGGAIDMEKPTAGAGSPVSGQPKQRGEPVKKATYRPFNEEEKKRHGLDGQVDQDGKEHPFRPRSGTMVTINKDGSSTYVQGSGVGSGEAKAAASAAASKEQAGSLIKDLNYLQDKSDEMLSGVTGALGRQVTEKISGTDQAANKSYIDRIVSNITLGTLAEMRQNSPTGAALSGVSDKDIEMLKTAGSNLNNAQSKEEFQKELIRLQNIKHDIVYGSEPVLRLAFRDGKINQAQFDEAMSKAPGQTINDRGQVITRKKSAAPKDYGLTPDEQLLMDKHK